MYTLSLVFLSFWSGCIISTKGVHWKHGTSDPRTALWIEIQAPCPQCTTFWSAVRIPLNDWHSYLIQFFHFYLSHYRIVIYFTRGLLFIPQPTRSHFSPSSLPRLLSHLVTFPTLPVHTNWPALFCNHHWWRPLDCGRNVCFWTSICPSKNNWLKLFPERFCVCKDIQYAWGNTIHLIIIMVWEYSIPWEFREYCIP